MSTSTVGDQAGGKEDNYDDRWEKKWASGLKPGEAFDAKDASPALVKYLHDHQAEIKGKRVIVPGCGRGYDVAAFLRHGAASAIGLELAPTAVTAANTWLDESGLGALRDRGQVVQGDFFEYKHPDGEFDIGYDYTFLCALHPSQRIAWARRWSELLTPGAMLITLMFPVQPQLVGFDWVVGLDWVKFQVFMNLYRSSNGPPWPLEEALYAQLLTQHGFECVCVNPVAHALSHPMRGGMEVLGIWKRMK